MLHDCEDKYDELFPTTRILQGYLDDVWVRILLYNICCLSI